MSTQRTRCDHASGNSSYGNALLPPERQTPMDVVNARCAGLDVHKATVVAGLRVPGPQRGERCGETKTFATTTRGLRELIDWLMAHGVTAVAMESTSVYWRPVHAVLEGHVQLVLVNARHVKMVPGRKTDVRDCEWLAELLECGLLRASFVPPRAVRDLPDLTRLRKTLIRERGHHVNRIEKTLELAQIKIGCVITDLMGKTGRAILQALSAGLDDPERLAEYAQGLLRKKRAARREARVGGHSHEEELLPRALPPPQRTWRSEESDCRRTARDGHSPVAYAQAPRTSS